MNLFSPTIAYASVDTVVASLDEFVVNPLIKFMFAIALVYFLYGLLDFLMNAEDEEKRTTGKAHMLWGTVGMTIMLGVWSILSFVLTSIGVKDTYTIRINDLQNGKVDVKLNDFTPPTIKIGK